MLKSKKSKLSVCVFCGAQNAVPQKYLDAGKDFGKMLADNNIALVYGGGDCGVMGAVANATLYHDGWVTGVFPENLRQIEAEHRALSKIIIVDSMHTRKEIMYRKSDMFVIFPGGFGTMDEMFEIITWRQLRLHHKPIVIFNQDGYWDHLVKLMESIIETGFARKETYSFFKVVSTLDELMEYINTHAAEAHAETLDENAHLEPVK